MFLKILFRVSIRCKCAAREDCLLMLFNKIEIVFPRKVFNRKAEMIIKIGLIMISIINILHQHEQNICRSQGRQ